MRAPSCVARYINQLYDCMIANKGPCDPNLTSILIFMPLYNHYTCIIANANTARSTSPVFVGTAQM